MTDDTNHRPRRARLTAFLKSNSGVLKFLWFAAVLIGAGWYAWANASDLAQTLRQVSIASLAGAAALLIAAKCLVARMIQETLARSDTPMPFGRVLNIYNGTQAAKYIPGSIWHFLGRAALYRNAGMTAGQINRAMLTENIWLVLGAVLAAATFIAAQYTFDPETTWLLAVKQTMPDGGVVAILAGLTLAVAAGLLVLPKTRHLFLRLVRVAIPNLQALTLMIAIQVALGLSFFALAAPLTSDLPILYVLAASALATGAGFLALFAPAGLGVKDVGLIVLLAPYMDAEVAFVAVSVHRLIYIALDLILSAIAVGTSKGGQPQV